MTRMLGPLRKIFRVFNRRCSGPLIRSGLGPLLGTPVTGSMLLLRTIGHKTGRIREAPLSYAIVNGKVVVVAGYGRSAHWFRNAIADPRVEVALPGAVFGGIARELTDVEERREAFQALIATMGVIGQMTVGDVNAADTARLDEMTAAFPVLSITPTDIRQGPYDPGGSFWRIPLGTSVIGAVAGAAIWWHSRTAGQEQGKGQGKSRCWCPGAIRR